MITDIETASAGLQAAIDIRRAVAIALALTAGIVAPTTVVSGRQASAPPAVLITRADATVESKDPTFGTAGVADLPALLPGYNYGWVRMTTRGPLVVACAGPSAQAGSPRIVRLTYEGRPDSTFGTNGVVDFEVEPGMGGCLAVAGEDSLGRLVLSGTAQSGVPSVVRYRYLARLLSDGRTDTTFGSQGTVHVPSQYVGGVAVTDDNGVLVAAGGDYTVSQQRIDPVSGAPYTYRTGAVAVTLRFDQDGTLDPGFGSQGRWLQAHAPNPFIRPTADCDDYGLYSEAWHNPVSSVFALSGDQFVLAGAYRNNACADVPVGSSGIWVARYNRDLSASSAWVGAKAFPPPDAPVWSAFGAALDFNRGGLGLVVQTTPNAHNVPSGDSPFRTRIYRVAATGAVAELREAANANSDTHGWIGPDGSVMLAGTFLGAYALQTPWYRRYLPGGGLDGWYVVNEIDGAIIGGQPDQYSGGFSHFFPTVADTMGRWYGWSGSGRFSRTRAALTPLSALSAQLGSPTPRIAVSVRDADSVASTFVVAVRSSNQTVIADADIRITGMRPQTPPDLRTRWYLDVTPNRQPGMATISVDVSDGANVTTASFTVSVQATLQPPTALQATVAESNVSLRWLPPSGGIAPARYVVAYGPSPGQFTSAIAVNHPQTSTTFGLAPGRYQARVSSSNAAGDVVSVPTATVLFDVVNTGPFIAPPTNLRVDVVANSVALAWDAPSGGQPPVTYRVEAGGSPGETFTTLNVPSSQTRVGVPGVPNGRYFVRVRTVGSTLASAASNEVVVDVPRQGTVPGPPQSLAGTAAGSVISLTWQEPQTGAGALTAYLLDAGTAAGLSNLVSGLPVGTATSFVSPPVPSGVYFVRVRAQSSTGASQPSNEARIVVGGLPPSAPVLAGTGGTGGVVTLSWSAPAAGAPVAGYELHAGSAPGANDIGVLPLAAFPLQFSAANVPPGTYYVRIVANSQVGRGAFSNEVVLVVP